jgi:hypothetical protein
MLQVWVAMRLIAALMGADVRDLVCWDNTALTDAPHVCEWSQFPSDHPGGAYAIAWVDYEGGPVQWRIGPDPYAFSLANTTTVELSPSSQTLVQVETADAPVYLSFNDGTGWIEITSQLVDVGQLDPARIVLLPAGEGVVTFGSNGALFVAPYQLHPGPDPTQPA